MSYKKKRRYSKGFKSIDQFSLSLIGPSSLFVKTLLMVHILLSVVFIVNEILIGERNKAVTPKASLGAVVD